MSFHHWALLKMLAFFKQTPGIIYTSGVSRAFFENWKPLVVLRCSETGVIQKICGMGTEISLRSRLKPNKMNRNSQRLPIPLKQSPFCSWQWAELFSSLDLISIKPSPAAKLKNCMLWSLKFLFTAKVLLILLNFFWEWA